MWEGTGGTNVATKGAGPQAKEWPHQGSLPGCCEQSGSDGKSVGNFKHLTSFNKITLAAVLKTWRRQKLQVCQEVNAVV